MQLFYVTAEPAAIGQGRERIDLLLVRQKGDRDVRVALAWERGKGEDWKATGLQLSAPTRSHGKAAMLLYPFSRFIKGKIGDHNLDDPDMLLTVLEKHGAKHGVWDERVRKFVDVREIEDGTAVWRATDVELEVSAEDEDGAKKAVTKLVQETMQKEPTKAAALSKWYSHGMKVEKIETKGEAPKPVKAIHYVKRSAHAAKKLEEAEASKAKA